MVAICKTNLKPGSIRRSIAALFLAAAAACAGDGTLKAEPTSAPSKSAKSPAPVSKNLKPKMGYKLVMKVNYFGRIEWAVSPDGARLTSPMLAITCLPPSYTTSMFNTETHKMKTFDRKKGFERLGAMMEGGLTSQHSKYKYSPWKKEGEEVIAGRKCTKFSRVMLNAQQDATRYATFQEEYWVSPYFDFMHVDELMAPLEKLTSREFTLMKGFGMKRIATWKVFRRGVKTPDVNDRMVYLNTLECKPTLIDPKIFDLGAGYTQVADEGEILFSDEGVALPGHF